MYPSSIGMDIQSEHRKLRLADRCLSGFLQELFNLANQFGGGDLKAACYSKYQGERWLALSTLKLAEIRSVNTGDQRKLVLSNAELHPFISYDRTESSGRLRFEGGRTLVCSLNGWFLRSGRLHAARLPIVLCS